MNQPNSRPILIIVGRGRWDAFPVQQPITARDRWLVQEIKNHGGISLTTPPGMYHFNIKPGPMGDIVTLDRVEN